MHVGLIAIAHPNARVVANSVVSARRKVAKQKLAGLGMQIDSSSPFSSFLTMQFFSFRGGEKMKISCISFFKIIYTCNTIVLVLTLCMSEYTMLRISTTKIKAPHI
jgi:hypothetical protein